MLDATMLLDQQTGHGREMGFLGAQVILRMEIMVRIMMLGAQETEVVPRTITHEIHLDLEVLLVARNPEHAQSVVKI